MWQNLKIETPATELPVSLEDVKKRLIIDFNDDDALITSLIKEAVARIDGPDGIGVALMEQTWELTLDDFPSVIRLLGWPIKSVSEITYRNASGVETTLDTNSYRIDTGSEPVRVVPETGFLWPTTDGEIGALRITYIIGEADDSLVNRSLVAAVNMMVAHTYQNREGQAGKQQYVDQILGNFSRLRVSS